MPLTRSSAAARKSLDKSRRSSQGLTEDSTMNYIWQYSETHQKFNPSEMNEYVDSKRKERDKRLFSDVPSQISREIITENEEPLGVGKDKTQFKIQKSLQLLDEVVGSPRQLRTASPLLANAGTPAPLLKGSQSILPTLKHSSYTPSVHSSYIDGDLDYQNASYFGATPGRDRLGASILGSRNYDATISLMDESGYTKPITPITGHSYFLEDMEDRASDNTQITGYTEKNAIAAADEALLQEFARSLTTLSHSSQVFELVDEYEKWCAQAVTEIHNFTRKTTPEKSRFSKRVELIEEMNSEKYTWRLIATLFRDRLESDNEDHSFTESMDDHVKQDKSEKEIIQELFVKEASARRNQMVVDWSERNNEDLAIQYIESQNVEYFGNFYNWENTLHSLQQSQPMIAPKRPFVTEMDPDAPVRQNRPIADLDVEDEERLLKYIFVFIRAGKLKEAQDLCIKCGQAWRAATLEGWKLYHNPNMGKDGSELGELEDIEGNPHRDIWKKCCWNMSEQECYCDHERSIYAALSGNLKQLLLACISWQDYLWAYFKVMVDVRVEQELRTKINRPMENLPSSYWDQLITQEKVFEELQSSSNESVRKASNFHFNVIQKHVILDNVEELIEEMHSWFAKKTISSQMLRFMTHLILFLRTTGLETKETMCHEIIEGFVEYLIKDKRLKLVALYTSFLPPDKQVVIYARFLEEINDKAERKLCFECAEACGLDIARITKTVVENIRGQDDFQVPRDDEAALEAVTSEEDKRKIKAIEWLVFDQSQRAEAVKQCNAIMRCFLALRKHEAARNIFDKLPEDTIKIVYQQWEMRAGDAPMCPEDSNSVREYLCIKAYLDALETFDVWFEHFHRNAPKEPVSRGHSTFTEKVAFEQALKQYEAENERWQRALDVHTKETTDRIYNVVLFPGGWMIDQDLEDEPRETRTHQLGLLRQLCIPFLIFILQSILSSTNQHKECLQLADIITSPKYNLYEVFRKDELRKLLSLLRLSSIEILEKTSDPLGYDVTS